MLTCQDVAHVASDHLDGELPMRRRLLVDAHLAICPNCRRYVAQLRVALGLAKAAATAQPAPTPEEEARLIELFEAATARGRAGQEG